MNNRTTTMLNHYTTTNHPKAKALRQLVETLHLEIPEATTMHQPVQVFSQQYAVIIADLTAIIQAKLEANDLCVDMPSLRWYIFAKYSQFRSIAEVSLVLVNGLMRKVAEGLRMRWDEGSFSFEKNN